MNFAIVRFIVGWILEFEAMFLLLPAIVAAIYKEWTGVFAFIATALLCIVFGFLLRRKPKDNNLYTREGFAAVALGWFIMSLFGAIPFVITGDIPNYIDALFETISGLTTTGASILNNVEGLSYGCLFWRSFSHWLGGMGVFVFIMAIVPLMGGSTMNLMRAESPGPSVGKLVPRVKDSAKILYSIYLVITIIEAIALCICGLNLFDSVTLTFGTVGTGGFGILNDSIASYSSAVQIIITIFMILSGINYTFYFCIINRQFKQAFAIEEIRWYLGIIIGSAFLIAWNISSMFGTFAEALKHSFFQVGSLMTSTGYSTTDFNAWPELSKTILLIIMFIGACSGSTGGGFKVSRMLILLKAIKKEFLMIIHPNMIKKLRLDKRVIPHETIRSTNVFLSIYAVMFFTSVLLISFDNFSFSTNFTAVLATINNMGPGFDLVGPTGNFSIYSDFSKCVLMFDMLAGRLELFPILILLVPQCWKKY